MSALIIMVAVIKHALTQLAVILVLVVMDTLWTLMGMAVMVSY